MEAAMTYSFLRTERPIRADPTNGRPAWNANTLDRIIAILTSPDFISVAMICAVGLLVTLALFFLVPSSRELTDSIRQML
jgi:hypothetical protein